jgi:phosphohistidine phosphatase
MLLHLVRHAHAVATEEDPTRPLSARGRGEVARLARFFLGNGGFQPAQVWHSPLRRSRETADDLVRRLGLDVVMVEIPGIQPEDDALQLADRLQLHPRDRGNLAIVGHEPHLSALAALLVTGRKRSSAFRLKKGDVLTLQAAEGVHKKSGLNRWRVRWHITPELLPPVAVPAVSVVAGASPSASVSPKSPSDTP